MSRSIDRQPEVKPQVQRDMQPQPQKPLPGKALYDSIKPAGVGIKDVVSSRGHASQKPPSGMNLNPERKSWAEIEAEILQRKSDQRIEVMNGKIRHEVIGKLLQKDKQIFNGMKSSITRSLPKFLVKVFELRRCLSKKISINEREIEKTFEDLRDKSLSPEEQKKIKDRRVKLIEDNEILIRAKRQIADLPDDLQIDLLEDENSLEKVS